MSPLQVAIVDDEPLARSRLRRLLQKVSAGRVRIAVECVDADDLVSQAGRLELDLIFLDVEMPGGGGFGALARWPGPRPLVVFVSAFPGYGVKAFDVRALDYLMKPVSAERLREALARAHEASGLRPDEATLSEGRIPLHIGQRTHLVPPADIEVVVSRRNYLEVHGAGATYVIRRTLAAFEADLEAGKFVRLHRSTLVRVAAIQAIKPVGSGRYQIELESGRRIYSGRNYRGVVHALLKR
jgi:two-component system LytT family response regulator